MARLHLGCGKTILKDWINLDGSPGQGVDVVANLDRCAETPLPFQADTIEEVLGRHVLEHVPNVLPLMQELHRVARAGTRAVFDLPYGSSDDAFEDPTHVRQYFANSFGYFSQPYYWRADYGYRGDWQPEVITLKIHRQRCDGKTADQVLQEVMSLRNVVLEMTVVLIAVKPIRAPLRELQVPPRIEIARVE
jgi:SAM-dependent methyltransferase